VSSRTRTPNAISFITVVQMNSHTLLLPEQLKHSSQLYSYDPDTDPLSLNPNATNPYKP